MFRVDTTSRHNVSAVSVDDVKEHLNITDSDNDNKISSLIDQVTRSVESFCGIAIGTQTKVFTWDYENIYSFKLPYGPVASITTVHMKDGIDYDLQVLNDDYEVSGGFIDLITGKKKGRIKVTYITGTDYNVCPPDLQLGILNEIAYRYENRGDVANEKNTKAGFSVDAYEMIIRYKDFTWE